MSARSTTLAPSATTSARTGRCATSSRSPSTAAVTRTSRGPTTRAPCPAPTPLQRPRAARADETPAMRPKGCLVHPRLPCNSEGDQASAVRPVRPRRRSLDPQGGPHEQISLSRADGFAALLREGSRRGSGVHLLPNTHLGAAVRIPFAWPSTCLGGVPDLRPNGQDAR